MLKNSKKFSRLKSEWKKSWKKELVDIFVFGSFARGKTKPRDIDICLVFRDKISRQILKKIETLLGENYHLSSLVVDNFFAKPHSLAKTLLLEGKSLLSGNTFADVFHLKANLLYSYNLAREKASKKVRFVYLLRGRGKLPGLVEKWKGQFISNNAFLVPINQDSEVREVLEKWRVKYQRRRLMLMD